MTDKKTYDSMANRQTRGKDARPAGFAMPVSLPGPRLRRRVLGLVLALSLLLNSAGIAVDGLVPRRALSEESIIAETVEPDIPEQDAELDAEVPEDAAQPPENLLMWDMSEDRAVRLSRIFEQYQLAADLRAVESVLLPGSETEQEMPALVSVEPLIDEFGAYDYEITALQDFDEARLMVLLPGESYTLALTCLSVFAEEPVVPEQDMELPDETVTDAPQEAEPAVESAIEAEPETALEYEPEAALEYEPETALEYEPEAANAEEPEITHADEPGTAGEDEPGELIAESVEEPVEELEETDLPQDALEGIYPEESRDAALPETEAVLPDMAEAAVAEEEDIDGLIVLRNGGAVRLEAPLRQSRSEGSAVRYAEGAPTHDTEWLRLSLSGGADAAVGLRALPVEAGAHQVVLEAYAVAHQTACEGVRVELARMPETGEGETLALYGLKGGALSDEPLMDGLSQGDSRLIDIRQWDGFALVRVGLFAWQQLPAAVVGDAIIELSGVMPVGASASLEPVERYEETGDLELTEDGGSAPAEDSALLTFDIAVADTDGGAFEPLPGQPLEVTVHSDAIRSALDAGSDLAVERLDADAPVEILHAQDGAVTFAAERGGAYVVREIVLEKTLTASDGAGYRVTVAYDTGCGLPADAGLSVTEIGEGDPAYAEYIELSARKLGIAPEAVALARAFDITLVDPATGKACQPGRDVRVSIRLLDDSLERYETIDVVHIHGGAEVMDAEVRGGDVAFSTDGFSVYVLTGTDGETVTPQCTYTFYVPSEDVEGYTAYAFTDAEGRAVFSQNVARADELVVPQLTSPEGKVFAGWYENVTDGAGGLQLADVPYDFDNAAITENSAVDLYAVFATGATVVFHDQYDSASHSFPVSFTRRAEGETLSAAIRISDVTATFTSTGGVNMAFLGWSETPVTTPGAAKDDEGNDVAVVLTDENGCVTVTGEKHLYPIFREVRWLTYYAARAGMNAAYVPPARCFEGETVGAKLPTTTRDGYTFLGWWTGRLSADGGEERVDYGTQITNADGTLVTTADDGGVYISDGELYLRADATLFARWRASYSIVYWKQAADQAPDAAQKRYEYAETVTRSADIGSTVTVTDADRADDRYEGYHFGHCDPHAIVGDTRERTALNVYYDLSQAHEASGQTHALTFADSVTGEGATAMPAAVEGVEYGAALSAFVPADPAPGRKSAAGRDIYTFSGWYLDQACTLPVNWSELTMPDGDLTVYAGWKPIKFRVDIDPNFGALYDENNASGTGATFFNNTYDAEPIGEYTHVTRNYVESSSGTWYYVKHDRAWGGDGHTYYTQDPSQATGDATFEYAPGVYTYVAWYEVIDGVEAAEPYDFSQHTDHDTTLRLHWKKSGAYYLAYAAGSGALEDGTKDMVLPEGYADCARIVLTESASAPAGYAFVGWQVRGAEDGAVHVPGRSFTLHSEDAYRVGGRDIVYLDAVYVKLGTAGIVYDANGGELAETGVDLGQLPGGSPDQWEAATGVIDAEAGTATVSGLINNTRFKLSTGVGFTRAGAEFLGWSDRPVCDEGAAFYPADGSITYGVSDENTLYAVWGVRVSFDLNSPDAEWGGDWDGTVYTLDGNRYVRSANIGCAVPEPDAIPVYTGADGRLFRCWGIRGDDPDNYTEYDFAQPVTGALELFACWSEPNTVRVHAVDASTAALADVTVEWTVSDITVGVSEIALDGTSHVSAPEGYAFAFAAAAADLDSVSEEGAVTAIKYDAAGRRVVVRREGAADFTPLDDGDELYFIYYRQRVLDIGYKSMGPNGALADAASSGPATTGDALGVCDVAGELARPLTWAGEDYARYAYAIGSGSPATANDLSLLTAASASEAAGERPALLIRNTWRGFMSSTDGGASWVGCGYDPALYVIYYTQHPTVVRFGEATVGTSAVMDTAFTFNYVVTETVTTVTSVQRQALDGDAWVNDGEPEVTETTGEPVEVYSSASGGAPCALRDGETDSTVIFCDETMTVEESPDGGEGRRSVTTSRIVTAQTVVITQTVDDRFVTTVSGDGIEAAEALSCACTADGTGGVRSVTFTNTHRSLPVEVHVAVVEEGGLLMRDDLYRSASEADYRFDLALGAREALLEKLPPEAAFTGDGDTYAFGAVVIGSGVEGQTVSPVSLGAASVAYARVRDNVHELVLADADGGSLGELGDGKIFYLYYPMPRIRYVKEEADGALTLITGCLPNAETGAIEASDSVTYSHAPLTMNGLSVTQNQRFELPPEGLVISQTGNSFRMPPILDNGLLERYLRYEKLGAGGADAANIADLDVSEGREARLQVRDNTLQYSFDGAAWTDLSLSGVPTLYAIYAERGYDLQISKAVDTSSSGENAIFTDSSFEVTVRSAAITRESYAAEGADGPAVAATPASGDTPGEITLTVVDGTKVRIKGLSQGNYTITETGNENYTLTARTGPIVGGASSAMTVTDNSTVAFTLNTETKVDLTNSPKAICKIEDNYFYTLRSMVEYVDENIPTKTAVAEMLTDYLMPLADTLEVPGGFNLTLTTAESLGRVAVITRSEALSGAALIVNNGTLALTNLTLEGGEVEASEPMIQSAGDLTIGVGARVQNAVNTGNGGAIRATAGDISVSGAITGNTAASGGAIYHAGNGAISLSGRGNIENNRALTGDGGAIHAAGGTIAVSGSARITGNRAENGKGGAIYTGNAVIEVTQNGGITNNTAVDGGAIYADTATVTVSAAEGATPPAITGNTATGEGGAIRLGAGSVTVSGGSLSGNRAALNGGAICAGTAAVTLTGTAEVRTNAAAKGGAVYSASGEVTVSGGTIESNRALTGDGGAICAGSGNVTLSGGSMLKNTAENGGAIHAGSGSVTVSGGSLTENVARTDGGAVYAGSGTITVTASDEGTAIGGNTATAGSGGALYAGEGAVSVTGVTLTGNRAGMNGGALAAVSGTVTLKDAVLGESGKGNTAGKSGGAVYAGSGNVTVSGGSMSENTAAASNGGALAAVSGVVSVSNASFNNNSAASGNGGGIWLDSGALTAAAVTMTGNAAVNGAAVFDASGRAVFNGGSYTGNTATGGGAIGVGGTDARLVFNGDVKVSDNTLDGEKSNVYLDQDDDAVINIDTLTAAAAIGIHVPDAVVDTRSVPGARFAVYTSNANAAKITNDRFPNLTVQSDTTAKKLYWGNSIKVTVRYVTSYDGGFTPNPAGTQKYTTQAYYPEFNDGAISDLAAELFTKNNGMNLSSTAVYAGAFLDDAKEFGEYLTRLTWDSETAKWMVTRRDGSQVAMQKAATDFHRIYIYYAEPAYISIENNTDMPLTLSAMTVNGYSVINSDTVAGYGMVFAKNGAIRTALLPIKAEDLALAAGASINLLLPGGRSQSYSVDGGFDPAGSGEVRLRRGTEGSLTDETAALAADGSFATLTGTTLGGSGTYQIIFGRDKQICKIVDAAGVEHPYSKISDAIAAVKSGSLNLTNPKIAVIEMLTDYLLPASDLVQIPQGYDITLTTAAKSGVTYPYPGEGERAILSRDSENTQSMINSKNAKVNGTAATTLRLSNLIFDGKSVRGNSDGGAVNSRFTNVYVDHVDFKNVYANNGGAMLVMFELNESRTKDDKPVTAGTVLDIKNSDFTGCTSTTTVTSNRLGGGAIVTNAETMSMENCNFVNCNAVDQAGAVFHRVDGNYASWTTIQGCTFRNCSANAAGGLELDSKNITVTDCTFEHCVAKLRNGGGFNAYMLNKAEPSDDCWITLNNCTFNDCQAYSQNGGGFRSTAVYTTVNNCTFTNTSGKAGGGISLSSNKAKKGEIYGCSFDRCTATDQGGGIYSAAQEMIIGDYTYTDEDGAEHTRHTTINNCTSTNEGGGVCLNRNANNTSLTITNASITGNQTKAGGKSGGGVYTNVRKVNISGSTITDNSCTNTGGGVYAYSYTSLTIEDSDISRNIATSNGGGVWFEADSDANRAKQVLTIKGSTIDGNTSGGIGGGFFTQAKTVSIAAGENGKRSSISGNTAKNGGGVYQLRNVDGSRLDISGTAINGNTASNGIGGGVYAAVRTLALTDSEVSRNSATGNGGGVCFDGGGDADRAEMSLSVRGVTFDSNTTGNNGGGIYTQAKTVSIGVYEGEGGRVASTISNCTATASGGGIFQKRNIAGSSLTLSNTTVSGCVSGDTSTNWDHGGGGVLAYVHAVTVTGCEIRGNSAKGKGGGICSGIDSGEYMLTVDGTKITGNTSANMGGGIATGNQLTLRNATEITGNRLTTNDTANCAGVYLINGRTLFVGPADAAADATDTIYVRDNTTANGAASNLRLWEDGGQNKNTSAYVYCNLDGEIRVVNANKVGTWFASAKYPNPEGFSDTDPVFKADHSTLHGIIDRNDESGLRIIWAGPPIAKITGKDASGNDILLYLKNTGNGPAIFDRLGSGSADFSSVAAFNMLCTTGTPPLYTADGTLYEGGEYAIKMLDSFETPANMNVVYVAGRTITFTTAGKGDTDGYPYVGPGTRATVTRASKMDAGQSTLNANGNLKIENIVVDGGSENGVSPGRGTRCMYMGNGSATVTLGENALFQNGRVGNDYNGGGISLTSGTLRLEGGVIRNCGAANGGGIYQSGGTLVVTAGNIFQCTATGSGGGVFQNNGAFTMNGGTVSGCAAAQGGGVYVANYRTFEMNGSAITGNSATTKGGGIAVGGDGARLKFSGKVNVSGNTCDVSVAASKACNVEMDRYSYAVINTHSGGLYPGAYIGVYVPGEEGTTSCYDKHGVERKPFGSFASGDNTSTFYSFVNDRNGLKGGIIEQTDSNYVSGKNCIYWIQIFSLQVSKHVEAGNSTVHDPDEQFLFKVNVRGAATVSGQLDAKDIDSRNGDYGEMQFTSNHIDTTSAVFALKDGETLTGVNLSEGLTYEIIEYLTVDQSARYAAMPMNGYSAATESLRYDGRDYTVVRANTYSSTIGENKSRTDIDPYTSAVAFTNLMPVCKITDYAGQLLYRRYSWNDKTYYAPAVYAELTGDDGAFKALEGKLYTSGGSNPISYGVENGVKIQMLIGEYTLGEAAKADTGKVTLTTASASDALFPKQDAGTTSTIRRAFTEQSMFTVSGDLTLDTIILDGAKASYITQANGGIASVPEGGKLTIQNGATLQNARTAEDYSGGAMYVDAGGTVVMTGGTINLNESDGDGAGIYLKQGATLKLSGNPGFGGTGVNSFGTAFNGQGNFKNVDVIGANGGMEYTRPRQDIYLEENEDDPASIVLTGSLDVDEGSLWIWAATDKHYAMMRPFAAIEDGATIDSATYVAFRNARPDTETGCSGDEYLSGSTGEKEAFVYWAGGFDVSFMKIDGFGHALPGATFALYTDAACIEAFRQGGEPVTATSADGTDSCKNASGVKLEKGAVLFEQISGGVYYMKETVAPTQDPDGNPMNYVNGGTYLVLVGSALNSYETYGLTEADIAAQTGEDEGKKDAAIFLLGADGKKAVTTPDIAKYGLLNVAVTTRKAILKKVDESDAPLAGAAFEILRVDRTPVSSTDIHGVKVTTFVSGGNGVYFIDMLPYGTYYLHETTTPDAMMQNGDAGWWYTVTVDANGVACSPQSATEPETPEIPETP